MATTPQKSTSESLLQFAYEGTNRRGIKIKGDLAAKNLTLAKAYLRKQGIQVVSIKRKTNSIFSGLLKRSIKPMDIAIFTRQMATMMKAGVPLIQSFDIVAEGLDNITMRDLVLAIKNDVESGSNFSDALRKHPLQFDDLFCALVASGEQSGSLETMLDRVATYKEKSELLKQKIKKALKYPIVVVLVACIVTAILLLKVVPVFEDLFSGFGAQLPAFTQMVINMSRWLQANWLIPLVAIGALIFGTRFVYRRNEKFRNWLDKVALKLPVFGDLVYKTVIARFSRTLATTFAAGVPLIDALDSAADASGNAVYANGIRQIKDEVATGQQLNFAMRQSELFPSMAVQMVSIGEESGRLDEMLDKVANHFENEVDNAVDGLTSMLEPMIMAFLGVVVGGLVVAMYLPIFQLGAVV